MWCCQANFYPTSNTDPVRGQGYAALVHIGVEVRIDTYFEDHQRREVQAYYGKQSASGHWPLERAKKNNGCLPLGQGNSWGSHPLARSMTDNWFGKLFADKGDIAN
jgi:hypothetical protein